MSVSVDDRVKCRHMTNGCHLYSAASGERCCWMRRHSLSGVAGMSRWRIPSGFSASTRALVIAAGAPIAPASPQPLTPSGLWVHRVTLVDSLNARQIVGARHRVIVVGAGQQLPGLLVVDAAFEQCLADALGEAAMDLALDDHRVEDAPEIVARGEIDDLVWPVSGSISTSAIWAPDGKVKFFGS